jgi:TolA-binding protein
MRLETSPPSSVAPPSIAPPSLATPRPPTAAPPDPYTRLFEDATKAYLRRDYDRAERLFAECVTQRPGDRRAEYNLRKLKERKVSP